MLRLRSEPLCLRGGIWVELDSKKSVSICGLMRRGGVSTFLPRYNWLQLQLSSQSLLAALFRLLTRSLFGHVLVAAT